MNLTADKTQAGVTPDWLGIPGLRRDTPIDETIRLLAQDITRAVEVAPSTVNPVKYEIAVHRIVASLREGTWALARTSSSPLVTECGEYMFAIYDAQGHAAAVQAGVLPHITGTQSGIKFIRHCYEADPEGIHPGDQFIINDPYLLGLHTPDVLVARPIFAGARIVAWVGSLTHTLEMGAKDPGGTADSTDIFQEGLRLPCLKLVRRGVRDNHLCRLIGRAVRSPEATLLDVMAKVAGNNIVAARLDEMVEQEGADFLPAVLGKMIAETQTKALERIRALPDGRWETQYQTDHNGREQVPMILQLSLEKKDGRLHFDFAGTSAQAPGPVNCTLPGTAGGIFSALVTTLFHDLHPNQGIVSACSIDVPEGCFYNPRYPAPVFASPAGPMTLLSSAVTKLVSEMAMAGGLSESVTAPWNGNFNSVFMGGVDQYGKLQGTLTMDSNGGGTGGTPFDDGDDTAAFMLAPGSIMSDVEIYEATYPLLYLYRRQRMNSSGHGQWRGGLGGEAAVAVHGSTGWRIGFRGLGTAAALTHGLFGGYPAAPSKIAYARGVLPQCKSPLEYSALLGQPEALAAAGHWQLADALTPPRAMAEGDVYYLAWAGGGGYGDPLLRDSALVVRDVGDRLFSVREAIEVYGVVIAADGKLDTGATEIARTQALLHRLASAEEAADGETPRPAITGRLDLFAAHVGVGMHEGKRWLTCTDCRTGIAPVGAELQQRTPYRIRRPAEFGHDSVSETRQIYREHFCPGCGRLLEVVVVAAINAVPTR